MNSRRARLFAGIVWHLAFLAMMLTTFAVRGSASWQCGGRICGISAWACCCVLPDAGHDPGCGPSQDEAQAHFTSASHAQETNVCAANCHCTMVVQNAYQPLSRAAFFSPPSTVVLAVLPATHALAVPRVAATVRPIESRGPPLNTVCFASPSLRAPPVA